MTVSAPGENGRPMTLEEKIDDVLAEHPPAVTFGLSIVCDGPGPGCGDVGEADGPDYVEHIAELLKAALT